MGNDTLFIADLHLHPSRPAIIALLLNFLARQARDARALFILGDLFEAWIGDDDPTPEYTKVRQSLRQLRQSGTRVSIMHGNRDFLLGEDFCRDCDISLLPDELKLDLDGVPALLMHGDTLCTDDEQYQEFRTTVRDPKWKKDFLSKPLEKRQQIAIELRDESVKHTKDKPPEIMDVNQQAVVAAMARHKVSLLVHGHTHRPAIHEFSSDGMPMKRIVLGDWYTSGSVLRYRAGDFALETLTEADH